jgi:thiol:disulfide interchange protein
MKFRFRLPLVLLGFSLLLMLVTPIHAEENLSLALKKSPCHSIVRLVSDVNNVKPGTPFKVGAVFNMQPDWHIYYKENGDAGMPTTIHWYLPAGFKAGDLLWEKPEKFEKAGIVTYGYANRTILVSVITPPANIHGHVQLSADAKWLCCREECLPGKAHLVLDLPVSPGQPTPSASASLFNTVGWQGSVESLAVAGETAQQKKPEQSGSHLSLFLYLFFAFVGGIILNFMPCVLPVVALKVVGIVNQAHDDVKIVRAHALAFTGGMISTFIMLAAAIIGIQSVGGVAGWGFLFQFPPFVAGMAVIIWLLALSLFGQFYITAPGQNRVAKVALRQDLLGSFFKGLLATLLSTPCTAPFLGTAVGFALAQNPLTVLLIFLAIGLGMALPYSILILSPALLKFLPKPGAWMERFKELMGFILIGSVIWLLGILGHMVGTDGLIRTIIFMTSIALVVWLTSRFKFKGIVWTGALLIAVISFYGCYAALPGWGLIPVHQTQAEASQENGIAWRPYTAKALKVALSSRKIVFLDFTADWCLTCKANERLVLESPPVIDKMKAMGVVPLQADWTTLDPDITTMLRQFHRAGVPLYVIFLPNRPPIVLPELITQQIVVDALEKQSH